MRDDDRFLQQRGKKGIYNYFRRVPKDVEQFDTRTLVQISLKTADLALARKRRDAQEAADDALWDVMRRGHSSADLDHYKSVSKLARSLGFEYMNSNEVAGLPLQQIYERSQQAAHSNMNPGVVEAVLGSIHEPVVTVSQAFEIYFNDLCGHEKLSKSPNQYKSWKKVKLRAKNNFIDVVGDVDITSISRIQAQDFYKFWKDRIETEGLSASAGNRDVGNMRCVYREYHKYIGQETKPNPFRGLSFIIKNKKKRKRPPFSVKWIKDHFFVPNALQTTNKDAALIFYTLIDTGCRPSEIANIKPHHIKLNDPVPHLRIEPDEREIKTESSERVIPLIGVALEAMKLAPNGFPRYQDKDTSLSNLLMNNLEKYNLLETEKHKVYSLRHSFEDRMKEAGLDYELRCDLMGHDIDRADYGEGGSLQWKRDQLAKIALPFPSDLLSIYA